MTERPILFSGPMVRAILEGRKTQTRRVVKPQPVDRAGHAADPFKWSRVEQVGKWFHIISDDPPGMFTVTCPYGQPGDRLWVRETFRMVETSAAAYYPVYKADGGPNSEYLPWKPSIHMSRWASRITLEITGVRVERVQEIGEKDVMAEGYPEPFEGTIAWAMGSARWYRDLWDSINAKRGFGWDKNPFCWVISFKRVIP